MLFLQLNGAFYLSCGFFWICRKKDGKCLYTCAVRPAAIYGPGEERHLPRIVSLAKLGLLPFKIGETRVKTDWIYVDNLVLALILASMGLLDDIPGKEGHPVAAGQPYFVSDGKNLIMLSKFFSFVLPTPELELVVIYRFILEKISHKLESKDFFFLYCILGFIDHENKA